MTDSRRITTISPTILRSLLDGSDELAILDVREQGIYATGHLFYAASAPLSRLELVVHALVPRRSTPIVLTDDDASLVFHATIVLERAGYTNIRLLEGGNPGWQAAGLELFQGVFVPSKAFGEFVEHHAGTPHIEPSALKALQRQKHDLVILDSRPWDEFVRKSIPGGLDCPGAELVYRINEVVKSEETLVVVNCAGRTRSIIGAQSLINAGIRNRVVALKNGTMGWHLAGFDLARGEDGEAPTPSKPRLEQSQQLAEKLAERAGVKIIDHAGLSDLRRDQANRSLYIFDVRSPQEYVAGHLAGSRSAPGGQLVQETDGYAATLNARIVLIDDDGVRARVTASWLIQMGWCDVFVLDDAFADQELELGPERVIAVGLLSERVRLIDPIELGKRLEIGSAFVADVDNSRDFRLGHVPGAWFASRANLRKLVANVPAGTPVILTSCDGSLARLAALDLQTEREVFVLTGGTDGWKSNALPLEKDAVERVVGLGEDVWYKPYEWPSEQEKHMSAYLEWELQLVEQVARDGSAKFRLLPPATTANSVDVSAAAGAR